MARPLKDGVDYFPLDTGFFQDKKVKLIKGEFGTQGIVILIAMLSRIYSENGYYAGLDQDDCILLSDDIGCGVTPELVGEVVQGCVRRSLFHEGVFNAFGMLTSPGIQRRYLRAVAQRDDIEMIKEYWLLDIDNKKDVQPSIRNKITFKSISIDGNPDKTDGNPDKTDDNPKSKVKESIGKESKEDRGTEAPDKPAPRQRQTRFVPPTIEEVQAYCAERNNGVNPQRWHAYYSPTAGRSGETK